MKKSMIISLLVSALILCGCAKKYDSVSDYATAMNEVRAKAGDLTFEVSQNAEKKQNEMKCYLKGNKWNTVFAEGGLMFDGSDVYAYSNKNMYAIKMPFKEMFEKAKNNPDAPKSLDVLYKFSNPVGPLVYWDEIFVTDNKHNAALVFAGNNEKNGFPCRMIKNSQNEEACISDKYGVAVYMKVVNPKNNDIVETNVKSIKTGNIDEKDINLPEGMKKVAMSDLLQAFANMMKGSGK